MDYINLKERKDIVKLGIKDENGNVIRDNNGNEVVIEFDLGNVNLPLNYNKCGILIEEAKQNFRRQLLIIDKKQDHKGKGFLSANENEKIKALKQFYKEQEEAMDLFLGKGGTRKFLNGREPYFEMWDDIAEELKPHLSKFDLTLKGMEDRIKSKYKLSEKESDVIAND